MRIARIELIRAAIPLKTAFVHASATRDASEAILVRAEDEVGHVGWGEIQPRAYVTGETIEGVLETHGPASARAWLGRELLDFDAAVAACLDALDRAGRNLALACGLELAILDLAGRRFGAPLARALLAPGAAPRDPLPGGVIIGFELATEKLAKHAAMLRLAQKTHLKVKVGRDDDVARVRAIAGVLKDVPLRLDANEAWTADETIARLRALDGVRIASIEQPVPAADLEGMRRIRAESGVPVMADESLCSLADAERLVGFADVFHVRLGKMGGVLGARRISELARREGIGLLLGAMVGETGILCRAAEVFGRCVPGFDCLDGKGQNEHLLSDDVLDDPKSARAAPLDVPGLGIEVSSAKIARWAVGTPLSIR